MKLAGSLKKVLSMWLFVLVCSSAMATHFMGVDITYTCLPGGNGCIFRVFHNTYYDCTGQATPRPPATPFAPTINFQGTGTTFCNQPVPVGNWVLVGYVEVTPVCPGFATACTNPQSAINGVREARYYRDYNFCNVNCSTYTITWGTCCRNGSINSGAANAGIYTGVTTIDLSINPCNSSPQFSVKPVPYICQGQNFTFNQGAFDPDGDSLAYALVPCQANANGTVTYGTGYTATQPMGPNWTTTINATTGDITVAPNSAGANPGGIVTVVLCVSVSEYRGGVKIGEVVRDIQMTVINCGSNRPPSIDTLLNITGGSLTGPFKITSCANDPLSFDVITSDPNATDSMTLRWNSAPLIVNSGGRFTNVGGTVNDTIIGRGSTPPVGRFSWTPTTPGNYQFLVTVEDDGCPLFAQNTVTIELEVISCRLAPTITTRRVGCFDVEFTICPGGGIPPYNYSVTGAGGLNVTANNEPRCLTFVHTFPPSLAPTAYQYTALISDQSGLQASVGGSVTLSNTAIADAGPDIALCPNQSAQIGTPALPGYNYIWQGSTTNLGLPNGPARTVAQPFVSLNNTTPGTISVTYLVTATDSVGCVRTDSVEVDYNPKPRALFNASSPVCVGASSTLNFTGIRSPGTVYNWNFGNGTDASGSNTAIGLGPHLVSWNAANAGPQLVQLQITVNGCQSDVASQTVQVNPIPTATFRSVTPVCAGQASILTYAGTASAGATYTWDLDGGNLIAGSGQGPITVSWSTPGLKFPKLQVSDRGCLSSVFEDTVDVAPIPTADFNVPSQVCEGDTIRVAYTGTGGPNAVYTWNFSGGTDVGSGQGPIKVVWEGSNAAGVKQVCLQVQERGCFSTQRCQNVNVLPKPLAVIDPIPNQCFGGNSFNFVYSGTPNPDTYNWGFPGGSPSLSSGANPTGITYPSIGIKTANVVVTKDGCISDPASVQFEVVPEPRPDFSFSNGAICSDDGIAFTYSGTVLGPSQTFVWNFGQNSNPASSSLNNPGQVTYSSGGTKTVSLAVTFKGCTQATAKQVTIFDSPDFSAGTDKEFCEGDGGVQINATASGGTPTYTYSWWCNAPGGCGLSSQTVEDPFVNPGAAAPAIVQYYTQLTDANGCTSKVDTIDVFLHPKPLVDAGPDKTLCEDEPGVELEGGLRNSNLASGPFEWQWTPTNGMNSPNDKQPRAYTRPDTTTIYTLQVTDLVTGCKSDVTTLDTNSTATVFVNPKPVADAGPDTTICFQDFLQLQGSGSGAGPDYAYTWSPTNTGFISNPNSPGPLVQPQQTTTYSLVVSSNDCPSDADQVTITVLTLPTINPGPSQDVCLGDSVVLDGLASGDQAGSNLYNYTWSPINGLSDPNVPKPKASPDVTTTYSVVATSEFGCGSDTARIDVVVNPTPVVSILQNDSTICEGDTVTLKAQAIYNTPAPGVRTIYSWAPIGAVVGNPQSQTVQVVPNQSTRFVVTASAEECATSDELFMTVAPAVVPNIEASDTSICAGETIVLTAVGGRGSAIYTWSPSLGLEDSASEVITAQPGQTITYTLNVDEGFCSGDTTLTIEVKPTPISDYLASSSSGCSGLEVTFMENTTDAIAYIWNFGDGTPVSNEPTAVHVFEDPGSYTVSLTAVGENGCESTTTKEPVVISDASFADFAVNPGFDVPTPLPNAGFQFQDLSQQGVRWFWDFGDGNSSTEQNPTHEYNQEGTYTVTLVVTDANGCVSQIEKTGVTVISPDIRIPNVFTPNNDGIHDLFLVQYEGKERFALEIFDRWGKPVFSGDAPDKGWDGKASTGNDSPNGVYYYTVMVGEKVINGNITLMR
ncbi:MAG: PKD domain-containing protein [Bacteroidota bacterium]